MSTAWVYVAPAFIGLPLALLFALNLLPRRAAEETAVPIGYLAAALQMVFTVVCVQLLYSFGKDFIDFSLFWDMNAATGSSFFSVDFFSLVVLFCIGLVAFAALAVVPGGASAHNVNFVSMMLLLMLGMNGIAVATDLFTLYIFLEITGICSFVMIAMKKDQRGLEGAFKYLVISAVATALLLSAFALIFMQTGSLNFDDVAVAMTNWQQADEPRLLMLAFILLLAGFCIKSGVVPFHLWVPDAYQSAPAAVSVLLGGIVTKAAGVYAMGRVMRDILPVVSELQLPLLVLGVISILVGAIAAVTQQDFKRVLAYSSISQIGYIMLGISCGSAIGYVGAILHFFNHAVFKSTLFVNAAALEMQVGTTDMDKLGGLQKQMPVTGISSVLAFLSTAGIPPLSGFWSKLLIIMAAWLAGQQIVAGIALFAGIFTAAYFLRLQKKVFFGEVPEQLQQVEEAGRSVVCVSVLLSAITVGLGVAFPWLLLYLQGLGVL